MKKFFIAALFCLLPLAAVAGDTGEGRLTPDAAFATMSKQRTAFDFEGTAYSMAEKEYLSALFAIADDGVAERVSAMQAISSGKGYNPKYRSLLQQLSSLEPPGKLKQVHELVSSAIKEQRDYIEDWRGAGGGFDANAALVRSSSSKLIQAYTILVALDAKNQAGYYNHLCALDFI